MVISIHPSVHPSCPQNRLLNHLWLPKTLLKPFQAPWGYLGPSEEPWGTLEAIWRSLRPSEALHAPVSPLKPLRDGPTEITGSVLQDIDIVLFRATGHKSTDPFEMYSNCWEFRARIVVSFSKFYACWALLLQSSDFMQIKAEMFKVAYQSKLKAFNSNWRTQTRLISRG